MKISVTPEMEAKLIQRAAAECRSVDEVVLEMLGKQLEYELWVCARVEEACASLKQGEYVTHEEVKQRLGRYLEATASPLV